MGVCLVMMLSLTFATRRNSHDYRARAWNGCTCPGIGSISVYVLATRTTIADPRVDFTVRSDSSGKIGVLRLSRDETIFLRPNLYSWSCEATS